MRAWAAAAVALVAGSAAAETVVDRFDSDALTETHASCGATTTGDDPKSCVQVNLEGRQSVALELRGTFVATITPEFTINGTNWTAGALVNMSTGARAATATGTGVWLVDPVAGAKTVRARVSAYTSGTVLASLRGSFADPNLSRVVQEGGVVTTAEVDGEAPCANSSSTLFSAVASRTSACVQNKSAVAVYVCKAATCSIAGKIVRGGDAVSDGLGANYCIEGYAGAISCAVEIVADGSTQYVHRSGH